MHQKSDVESGLYYCDFRYYNPQWGRFISPDGIDYLDYDSVSGLNLYAYCNNNPVMYSDGDGHMPKWVKWLIGGAVAGATIGAASGALLSIGQQVIHNGFDNFSWAEVGMGTFSGFVSGAIAGGIFGGLSYKFSSSKIASATSQLEKAESNLNGAIKASKGVPYINENLARSIVNYNNAYSTYIVAKGTYSAVVVGTEALYFGLENLTSYLIGMII